MGGLQRIVTEDVIKGGNTWEEAKSFQRQKEQNLVVQAQTLEQETLDLKSHHTNLDKVENYVTNL